jgi:hypothetical protein
MNRALLVALALAACGGAGPARPAASGTEDRPNDDEALIVAGVELPPLPHGIRLDRAPLEAGIEQARETGDHERPVLPDTASRAEVDAYVAGPLRTWMLERGRGLGEARRSLAEAEREEAEDGERAVAAAVVGVLYVRLALELAELPLPASVRSDAALRLGVRNALLEAAAPLFTGAESAFAACAIACVRSTDPSLEPWERFCDENAVEAREAPRPIDDGGVEERREAEDGDAG